MVSKRSQAFKCATAVALISCVVLLYPRLDASENYWSFFSVVCRHCISFISTRQRERSERVNINKKTYLNLKPQKRKRDSKLGDINQEHSGIFNVTELVFRELSRGFFAATAENSDRDFLPGPSLTTVCVSEPTLLECENAGFAALLLATLDHVSYCNMLGIYNIIFQWQNCQTSCVKEPGLNSWPAYFEPLYPKSDVIANKVLCLGGFIGGRVLAREAARAIKQLTTQQINQFNFNSRTSSLLEVGFKKRQSLPGYEEGAIITPQLRKWVHGMITEYIRPQKSIQLRVEQFYTNHMQGFNVLGVHVRGTDHGSEMEEKKLPNMERWIRDAEAIFDALEEPKKIFLASDNDEIVTRFVKYFGENKVAFTKAKRAKKYHSAKPVHSTITNDAIEIGSQVFIDILLLAKCMYFLHGESSVASLAAFFNPEMKLFFLGHLEDGSVDDDSDVKPSPDPNDEITEAEWEEEWAEELEALTRCYNKNSPYSACANMAKGQLIDSKDVREMFTQ